MSDIKDRLRTLETNNAGWGYARQAADRIEALERALRFYADPKNYASPSEGFALQYDPEPSKIKLDNKGNVARAALGDDHA
jgi:hypothetical protein